MEPSRPGKPIHLLKAIVFVAVLTLPLAARAADPLLMYVLGFAKNLLESSMQEDKARGGNPTSFTLPPTPRSPKAPASMSPEDLRALIDESFSYLNRSQRDELHTGVDKALADPANSAHREAMLNEFVEVARKVQYTHNQLNRLSSGDKRLVAERFAANSRTLDPGQQQALREQLIQRTLPMPTDLNDMMLAALTSSR